MDPQQPTNPVTDDDVEGHVRTIAVDGGQDDVEGHLSGALGSKSERER